MRNPLAALAALVGRTRRRGQGLTEFSIVVFTLFLITAVGGSIAVVLYQNWAVIRTTEWLGTQITTVGSYDSTTQTALINTAKGYGIDLLSTRDTLSITLTSSTGTNESCGSPTCTYTWGSVINASYGDLVKVSISKQLNITGISGFVSNFFGGTPLSATTGWTGLAQKDAVNGATSTTASTSGIVTGTVYDGAYNPIVGATVTLPGVGTVTTDSSGSYLFGSVAAGTYSISATYASQTSTSIPITVTASATTVQDIVIGNSVASAANVYVTVTSGNPGNIATNTGFETAIDYSSAVFADTPIADWALAETSGTNAADATGHGHNGSYATGSSVVTKTGYITVTAPVASFIAGPTYGPAGTTVTFADTSTGGPTSWSWNFGDSTTSTSQNPSHAYAANGTYTVVLTATNSAGSTIATQTGMITIASNSGSAVGFASTNAVVTGGWTSPTNAYASDLVYATAAPAKNGTVTSGFGGFLNAGSIPANATITNVSAEVKWKTSVSTSLMTLGAQLYNNGVAVGTETTLTTMPTVDTISTATVTSGFTRADLIGTNTTVRVRAARGNNNTAITASLDYVKLTVTYTVPGASPPVANFTASATSGQAPLTITFTGSSTNAPTGFGYDFTNDGTINATTADASFTYTAAGTYSVRYVVANQDGLSTLTRTSYITVSAPAAPSTPYTADFYADALTKGAPAAISFTDNSTGSPSGWAWTFGDAATSSVQNPSHTYTGAGTYPVSLTTTYAGSLSLAQTGAITTDATNLAVTNGGVAAYVSVPTSSGFDVTSAISLEAWVKYSGTTTTVRTIVARGNGTNDWYLKRTASNTLRFGTSTSGGVVNVDSPLAYADGAWHMVDGVYNGSTEKLYVDGALVASATQTGTVTNTADTVGLGATGSIAGEYWVGSLDEVAVYASALSQDRVSEHYQAATITGSTSGWATGTTYFVNPPALMTAQGATVHAGSYAGSVTTDTTANEGLYQAINGTFTSGHTYQALIWVNEPSGGSIQAFLGVPGAGTYASTTAAGTGAWQQVTVNWTPAATASSGVQFAIRANNGQTTALTMYVDDIQVWEPSTAVTGATVTTDSGLTATELGGGVYQLAVTAGTINIQVNTSGGLTGSAGPLTVASNSTYYQYITASASNSAPTPGFAASSTTGVVGQAITFTDTSSGGPTGWRWDFGDGASALTQNSSHSYSAAGTYTVRLTVTNSSGTNSLTRNAYITIYTATPPVANFTGTPLNGVAPLAVTFTDTSSNGPTSWAWTFGDSGTSTVQNAGHTYSTPGTYTVTLTATNAYGNNTKTQTAYVTVGAVPVTSFTGTPLFGAAPMAVTFTDASTNSPTSWAWNFGDSTTSTSQSPVHTYAVAGTYTVALTATNAYGSNTSTRTAYVTVGNAPVASFTGSPLTGLAPLTINFADASTNSPTSWSWNFGDPGSGGSNTSTGQNPAHIYSSAGTYTVALTATNAYGSNTMTRTSYITVSAGPSFVGSAGSVSTAAVASLTFSMTSTTGHVLVATIGIRSSTTVTVGSVTDSAGNTWQKAVSNNSGVVNSRVEIWYALNATADSTITINLSGGTAFVAGRVLELAGVTTKDATGSATSGSTAATTGSSGSALTTSANAIVVGSLSVTGASTVTQTGGWTDLGQNASTGTVHTADTAYKILTATGTYTDSWGLSPSATNSGAVVDFK
jgi:PKD repeat protein